MGPSDAEALAAAERAEWLAAGELLITEAAAVGPDIASAAAVEATDRSAHVLAKIGPSGIEPTERSAAA